MRCANLEAAGFPEWGRPSSDAERCCDRNHERKAALRRLWRCGDGGGIFGQWRVRWRGAGRKWWRLDASWRKKEFNTEDTENAERRRCGQEKRVQFAADQAMPSTPGVRSMLGWSCQVRRSSTAIFPAGMQVM